MFKEEREKKILDYVNGAQRASIDELSGLLGVSNVTVRKYVSDLDAKGLIIKTFGGAISVQSELSHEIPYSSKDITNVNSKEKIGKSAAQLVNDGDVIIIDSGSTTFRLVQYIQNKKITVITNDIKIGYELASKQNIKLIMCGGEAQKHLYTLIGSTSELFFKNIHVNKLFLGGDAVNKECISNKTLEEAFLKQAMIKSAETTILLVDSSKFNKTAFARVCAVSEIDKIVTEAIDPEYQRVFREANVEIILAK